ncbi:Bax inhibitor-1/YccA family protein [Actinomadura xylanilytica]|uniref:Bax inhibitor-1/YccA family protein n=1 Tax=Actinomadura xylanilytica TaxID=887459 RepID=UPI00255AEA7C|nr:Bax inhibitor-1/YccA family protein [Actinomadura xylanilytica]MDL4772300.1 Bax inhibitor-1/YccA family protein [Actinomadura xylanilytica]
MESRNPAFRGNAFGRQAGGHGIPRPQQSHDMYNAPSYAPPAPPSTRPMTMDDVVVRSFLTLATLLVTAALSWKLVPADKALPVLAVAVVAQLGIWAFITFGRKANAPLVLAFAAVYGVLIGVVSHTYNDLYHGVVLQAVVGTALAFGATLAVYALRIVRVTPKFTRFVIAAGLGLVGLMVLNLLVQFVGPDSGIGIRDPSNPLAYVFSVAAILIGCFFLLLDFDSIEQGVRSGAPEKFAWYCAFGLVLSLVWIYLEMLRLLSYFYGGRD